MSEPWFLLFGGSSPDGRGEGKYIGRTTDPKAAAWHWRKVHADPYSTGYVLIVTDKSLARADEAAMREAFSATGANNGA